VIHFLCAHFYREVFVETELFWTLNEFCTRLDLNERRTAKVLAVVPSRKRGGRTEYDFRLGSAAIYAELNGLDYRNICPHCLTPAVAAAGGLAPPP
jgi:hypothetical protein